LLDLIHMGLLPPLWGIYRTDLEDRDHHSAERARRLPRFRECRVDAVLLSHAHMDHCGYISFLDPAIPIFSSAMTAYLCKAIQDCGAYQFEGEMCYAVPKIADSDGAVGSARPKDFPFLRRPYASADLVPADPWGFWNLSPSASRGRYLPHHTLQTVDRIGPRRLRFFPVDHSIYGAAAIAVESSAGWIVYTGDLRRHGRSRASTDQFITDAAALSPAALICEGTNADRGRGPSEEEIFGTCLEAVQKAAGQLVIADFGARNVERLLAFLEIARRTTRRLVVMDKDAYLLSAMHAVDPAIPTPRTEPGMQVFRRALRAPRTWVEVVRDWYPDQVTAAQVQAEPGAYIVCMSFFDITELIDIDPSSGVWIYSSSEPHNEEQQIDLWRLHNWIEYFHLTPYGLAEGPTRYHASGHISGPELFDMVERIRPGAVIPIHTLSPHRFAEVLPGSIRVTIPEVGIPITVPP
jgi:ribonuclease J